MAERTLVDGSPVPEDDSHLALKSNGQQKDYVVLSEEERARGFVRPVRLSYRHVGRPPPARLRDLTPAEKKRHSGANYVAFEEYGPERTPLIGRYWTQAELERARNGGCGVVTRMSLAIAETYARNPAFYSGTFCCGCGAHYAVGADGEFVWDGTDERVGT